MLNKVGPSKPKSQAPSLEGFIATLIQTKLNPKNHVVISVEGNSKMAIQEALRPDAINGDMATDLDGSVASRWVNQKSV